MRTGTMTQADMGLALDQIVEELIADRPPHKMTVDWAAHEPKRLCDADFGEARLSRLVRRALEEQRITRSRAAEILGLTVEDMMQLMEDWL